MVTYMPEGDDWKGPRFRYSNVYLPGTEVGSLWNVSMLNGMVEQVEEASEAESSSNAIEQGNGGLLAPALCHPHIHLDKAFLLSHPRYSDLQVEKGDFQEAMDLTAQAKAQFEHADLLERGGRVIDESINAGVTAMRAFVEVDAGVEMKCVEAGIELKYQAEMNTNCFLQLCAFAQLPLFSSASKDPDGAIIRRLLREAANNTAVDVVGSTPYVETDRSKMESNVDWMIDLSMEVDCHLDFHLDYNLDPKVKPMVWYVIQRLTEKRWKEHTTGKTIVLGHCTALALWKDNEWEELAAQIKRADLPISFVGLPTSDLYMMRTGSQPEVRGTLNVPKLIKEYGVNACIGINNIGNAFTPYGSCDPLSLACQCIGIYQAGTTGDAELLYECVSTRAMAAIGFARRGGSDMGLSIEVGDGENVTRFPDTSVPNDWKTRKTISEVVYLYNPQRAL